MKHASHTRLCSALAGILLLSPASGWALGLRIADQDPLATARGNAFAATADNPSAIFYNPAGLAFLESQQARLGAYVIALESDFTSPTGERVKTKGRVSFVPQLYYSWTLKEQPLAFGIGLYSPYGLGLEWPVSTAFGGPVYGRMTYLTANPVVAWRVHPTLSLAAGLTANFADIELRQAAFAAFPGSLNVLKGDDSDFGYNLGLMWRPHEKHSFGVNYRSPTTQNFTGTSTTTGTAGFFDGTAPASARFPFPRHIVAGYSFRPTPEWNIEFNADWTQWDTLTTVTVVQPAGNVPVPFNWRSSWFYEFGVTRKFDGGWRVSGGYIYSENSVPDANFTPLVPDSDRHIFSVGAGRDQGRWKWDVAYQFAWGPSRTVAGSPLTFPLTVFGGAAGSPNGRYEFTSHALTASVGFSF
ncbi:MAG: outer membrane protein transport protein [Verrucomicrobia bacterium]|nr:outer membrane protein transport protein [Verrucomicrobiota bacterium]